MRDPQIALHLGVQFAADRFGDPSHDPVGLPVVVDVLDAAQDWVGAAHPHVRGPGTVRMLLVIAQVRQHTRPQLMEQVLVWVRRGVGGLEEPFALGAHHSGKERSLVREVVIHQRARNPGPFGDLVDADLVVRALAEHFGTKGQQFVAPIVG